MRNFLHRRHEAGSTWVEWLILVGVVLLLGAIAVPNFVSAKVAHPTNACMANLKQIAGAKKAWAKDHHKQTFDIPLPADLVGTNKYLQVIWTCPAGGIVSLGRVDEKPTCTVVKHNIPAH